jgi:hypothetical protein
VLNNTQNKHLANSMRIIGMAQFAHYGFIALQNDTILKLFFSIGAYLVAEIVALTLLKKE